MVCLAKKQRGLRSLQVLRQRRENKHNEQKLKQKKTELALKAELLHRLEVQFVSNDAVEIEVVNPMVLPDFISVLEDPSISGIYDYEQVAEDRFVFKQKTFL